MSTQSKKEVKMALFQLGKIEAKDQPEAIALKLLDKGDKEALKIYFYSILYADKTAEEAKLAIQEDFRYYQHRGYIKLIDPENPIEGYQIRSELSNIFSPGKANVEGWIEQWRAIFPKGGDQFGRYRGDRQGCINKMEKFLENNPKISVEQIFKATRNYVGRHEPINYQGMARAHYFIDKNGMSKLLGEIEQLSDDMEQEQQTRKFEIDA